MNTNPLHAALVQTVIMLKRNIDKICYCDDFYSPCEAHKTLTAAEAALSKETK